MSGDFLGSTFDQTSLVLFLHPSYCSLVHPLFPSGTEREHQETVLESNKKSSAYLTFTPVTELPAQQHPGHWDVRGPKPKTSIIGDVKGETTCAIIQAEGARQWREAGTYWCCWPCDSMEFIKELTHQILIDSMGILLQGTDFGPYICCHSLWNTMMTSVLPLLFNTSY